MIFRVLVLSPIPKNENSETHQKPRNTEIWVRNFKNPRNIVQITSKLQWFSCIVNHTAAIWVLKAFDPSEYIKFSLFLFMSVLILKQLKSGQNTDPHALECYKPENKDFPWFPRFRFVPYTQQRKLGNPENSSKNPKYWNVSMQLQKLFKCCLNDINLKMIQIYIHQIGFIQLSRMMILEILSKLQI